MWEKDNVLRGMEAFRTFTEESKALSHKSVLKVDVPKRLRFEFSMTRGVILTWRSIR